MVPKKIEGGRDTQLASLLILLALILVTWVQIFSKFLDRFFIRTFWVIFLKSKTFWTFWFELFFGLSGAKVFSNFLVRKVSELSELKVFRTFFRIFWFDFFRSFLVKMQNKKNRKWDFRTRQFEKFWTKIARKIFELKNN